MKWHALFLSGLMFSCSPQIVPAQEQTITVGRPVDASRPFKVELYEGEGNGHVYSIVVHNEYNYYSLLDDGESDIITIGDAPTVVLNIKESTDRRSRDDVPASNNPDTIEVVVPDGYVAVPSSVEVEERANVTIEIFTADSIPLG